MIDPSYWRNDYVAIEQWSRFIRNGLCCFDAELYYQHVRFAKLCDKNLLQQGFARSRRAATATRLTQVLRPRNG